MRPVNIYRYFQNALHSSKTTELIFIEENTLIKKLSARYSIYYLVLILAIRTLIWTTVLPELVRLYHVYNFCW